MPRGRPKNSGAESPEPWNQQLKDALAALAASGTVQWFYEIRRRIPGAKPPIWSFWKRRLPVNSVDDIAELCYESEPDGKSYEYKVEVIDSNGQKAVINNRPVDAYLPALEGPPVPKQVDPSHVVVTDPILEDRRRTLAFQRQELELDRQETELRLQRERLEKAKRGEVDEDDDEDGSPLFQPGYPGYYPSPPGYPPGYGYNPYGLPPWMQQPKEDSTAKLLSAMMTGFSQLAAALKPSSSTLDDMVKYRTLFGDSSSKRDLNPKDIIEMFTPFVHEMGKLNSEAAKTVMQNLAESDKQFRERVLDLVMASGAEDDDIEKWKKILGLVQDAGSGVIKTIFGRSHIVQEKGAGAKGEVKVPVIPKVEASGVPKAAEGGERKPNPEPVSQESPGEKARRIVKERIRIFLEAHEQEMLVGSDPALVADKLDELYFMLPETLRGKIEPMEVAKVYEELRIYEPEIVDRILKAVGEDESGARKRHCLEFWQEIRADDEEDEDGDEGEGEPETVPPDDDKGESETP